MYVRGRLAIYLDLLWMLVKREEGLALGPPKPRDRSAVFGHFVWEVVLPVIPLDLALMFVTGRSDTKFWPIKTEQQNKN